MIRAVLFDLDGILVDFAGCHFEALNHALREVCGRPVAPEDRGAYEGLSTRQKLALMVEDGRIARGSEDTIYRLKQGHTMLLAEENVNPSIVKAVMCMRLRRQDILLGCVSNCIRASVEMLLTRALLLYNMKTTVSNEDVEHPKPAPDPYLLACQRLGVEPHEALAVEDHERGVRSAEAAGCHVVQLEYEQVNYETVRKALDELKA